MTDQFIALEQYLRSLPPGEEELTLTFEHIEQILNMYLPSLAYEEPEWWGNQKQGTQVEAIAWMNAGWMVEIVNLKDRWVRFVRQ
jgi:hypothetical protein